MCTKIPPFKIQMKLIRWTKKMLLFNVLCVSECVTVIVCMCCCVFVSLFSCSISFIAKMTCTRVDDVEEMDVHRNGVLVKAIFGSFFLIHWKSTGQTIHIPFVDTKSPPKEVKNAMNLISYVAKALRSRQKWIFILHNIIAVQWKNYIRLSFLRTFIAVSVALLRSIYVCVCVCAMTHFLLNFACFCLKLHCISVVQQQQQHAHPLSHRIEQ